MPSFSYRIKSKDDKQVSIYISFRPQNSRSVFSRTGFTVHPSQWSNSKKRAKPVSPELKNLNNKLSELEIFLADRLNEDINLGVEITNKWLNKQIDRFNNKVPTTDLSFLLNLIDDQIGNLHLKKAKDGTMGLKKNTVKGYKDFRGVLVKYEEHIDSKIKINDFGKEELEGFVKWLSDEQQYAKGDIGRKIKRLKGLLKYGAEKGLKLGINIDAIDKQYSYKTKKHINVISEDEFFKILNLKGLPPYLENVRKWLLIGLNIGQRISDLQKIRKQDIRYDSDGIGLIDVIQVKGEEPVTIPVKLKPVIDIIRYRFPYPISDQKFNDYMKEVCKRASIDQIVKGYKMNPQTKRKELVEAPKYQLLASHDMRRSFATYHFDKGVSVNLIMKITGHKRESTFYEYIGRNPNKDLDAYNFLNA
ncbi:MAG: tyrosine-type recombinase/integrase [Flavobacteriaceae bacterium]|nr:tyrosine-type recombinase/integrase [Flavobacteriaceae bacterium]